jgi:NAD-dependent DNA ligase
VIGKDKLKALIEKDGGSATGFSGLTNVLVVGDNPGQKVLEAHEPKLTIADYDRHNDIIRRVWRSPMI